MRNEKAANRNRELPGRRHPNGKKILSHPSVIAITDNKDEGFDDMDDVEPASPDERPPTRKPHKHGAPCSQHSALPSSSSESDSSDSDYHVLNLIKGGNQRVSLNHYIFVVT